MCTLQTCPSAAARAVAGVPGAITATRHTNAQANARELIMIFVNFVFIVVVSCCLGFVVLAFFDSSLLRSFLAVHLSTWQNWAVRYAGRCFATLKSLNREALKPGGARAEVCVRLLNAESSSSQPEALDRWRCRSRHCCRDTRGWFTGRSDHTDHTDHTARNRACRPR